MLNWLDKTTGIKEWWEKKKGLPIPKHMGFFYCFGGFSLFLIILQVISGAYMLFFYVPDPEKALDSINRMANEVTLGWFFRNMHRWVTTLLMITLFSHILSVFYHKAYKSPREFNWITGVFQFVMVFFLLLTGLLLPWDWKGYAVFLIWLDYLSTWPLGGDFLKDTILNTFTLNRAFITHIWIIPLVLFVLLFYHFKMVRRHGISGPL